jgi:hypothetical protein
MAARPACETAADRDGSRKLNGIGVATANELSTHGTNRINRKRLAPWGRASSESVFRRCPALPRGLPRSTIGAEELNFRVRNGTGCFPFAVAAGNAVELCGPVPAVAPELHSGREPAVWRCR